MTIRVPKTIASRTVSRGEPRFTTPRVERGLSVTLLVIKRLVNTVGTTVKHPVMLPVKEKAASVLWATSTRPLTLMTLTSPAGPSLRLITPFVLWVVRALAPTVIFILVRVRVGVLPALLLATVIRWLVIRLLWTCVSPTLGAVLVTKLLMLVLVVTDVVARVPLFAITIACTFTVWSWVKCLPTLFPMTLPRQTMFSMLSFCVIIRGALFVCVMPRMATLILRGKALFRLPIYRVMSLVVFPWTEMVGRLLRLVTLMLSTWAEVENGIKETRLVLTRWFWTLNRPPVSIMTSWFLGALLDREVSRVVLVSRRLLILGVGRNLPVT